MKMKIKYCGGCNPSINRKKVVEEVLEKLRASIDLELVSEEADIALVVCGCTAACVNLDEIKDQARELVVVGGTVVDGYQVSLEQLASCICSRIFEKGGGKEICQDGKIITAVI